MSTWEHASKLKKLEGEITEQFMLENDALVDGEYSVARFHYDIRFNLYTEWTRLKEE